MEVGVLLGATDALCKPAVATMPKGVRHQELQPACTQRVEKTSLHFKTEATGHATCGEKELKCLCLCFEIYRLNKLNDSQ